MLDVSPEALSKHFGLIFERTRDHLDDIDVASIRAEAGVYALLGFCVNAPKKGFDVYIRDEADDPRADLAGILGSLEVADGDIIWSDFAR